MKGADAAPRSVAEALEEVARWRSEAEGRGKAELAEVDQEIDSLRTAIANLEQQISALRQSRDGAATRDGRLAEQTVGKCYDAIFGALLTQKDALTARSTLVAQARAAQSATLASSFTDPALARMLADYQQMTPEMIAAIPEMYRGGILEQHEKASKLLRSHVEAAAKVVTVEAPPVSVDVVYAVDSTDPQAQILWVVVPVDEGVHSAWATRAEDAQSWLAARVVQGVHAACAALGVKGSPAFGPHQGLLALEMELSGPRGDVAAALQAGISGALSGARELAAASILAIPRQVVPDHLLPPEEPQQQEVAHA